MIGEPSVSREIYMNHIRMRLVAMPMRSPIAESTPKACHSIKFLNRFMAANINFFAKPVNPAGPDLR